MRRNLVLCSIPALIGALVPFAKDIRGKFAANSQVTPNPSLSDLDTSIKAVELGELNKSPETMEALRVARQLLRNDLDSERGAVQRVVDTKSSYLDAKAIAESYGMTIKESSSFVWPDVYVRYGGAEGAAILGLKRVNGAMNYWQHSLTGTDWVNVQESPKARVRVQGLPLGQVMSFRYRRLVKEVFTDWSLPLQYRVR